MDLLSQKTDSSSAYGGSSGIDIAGLQTSTQEVEASVDKISKKLSDAFKIPGVKNFADQFNNGLKKIDFGNLKDNFSRIMAQMDPLAKLQSETLRQSWIRWEDISETESEIRLLLQPRR